MGIPKILKKGKSRAGFTLTEVLTVVGIVAVLSTAAFLSLSSIQSRMRDKEADNNAKAIFLAVQNELANRKSNEGLAALREELQDDSVHAIPVGDDANAGIDEGVTDGLILDPDLRDMRYVSSVGGSDTLLNTLLPVGSVDETIRNKKIFIEFDALSGNVYSVFYYGESSGAALTYGDLKGMRQSSNRKGTGIGYYSGDRSQFINGIGGGSDVEELEIKAEMTYNNNYTDSSVDLYGDAVIEVTVTIPQDFSKITNCPESTFRDHLGLTLTITSAANEKAVIKEVDLSHLKTTDDRGITSPPSNGKLVYRYILDSVLTDNSFETLNNHVIPMGENVNITLTVSYTPEEEIGKVDMIIPNDRIVLSDINPLYEDFSESGGSWTIKVANARNLQNLNAYASSKEVGEILLTDDIVWYNKADYEGLDSLMAADPVFEPLSNETLFGELSTINYNKNSEILTEAAKKYPCRDMKDGEAVLSDFCDTAGHAVFNGNGKTISKLKIRSSDDYIGLFAYINTTVKDLTLSGCTIEATQQGSACPTCVGALAGCMGGNSDVNTCTIIGTTVNSKCPVDYVGMVTGWLLGGQRNSYDDDNKYNYTTNTGCVRNTIVCNGCTLTAGSGSRYIGGLVGYVEDGRVLDCSSGMESGAANGPLTMSVGTNDDACIGGIVGAMDGGQIERCNATGTIEHNWELSYTSAAAEDNGYQFARAVGGAVGLDVGSCQCAAYYYKVSAVVALLDFGHRSSGNARQTDPSGLGVSIGKFVGYAVNGDFQECAGTGYSADAYEFLGQIYCRTVNTGNNTELKGSVYRVSPDYSGTETEMKNGNCVVTDAAVMADTMKAENKISNAAGLELHAYDMTLTKENDCQYSVIGEDGTVTMKYQIISDVGYYKKAGTTLQKITNGMIDKGSSYVLLSNDYKYALAVDGTEVTALEVNGDDSDIDVILDPGVDTDVLRWQYLPDNGIHIEDSRKAAFRSTATSQYLVWNMNSIFEQLVDTFGISTKTEGVWMDTGGLCGYTLSNRGWNTKNEDRFGSDVTTYGIMSKLEAMELLSGGIDYGPVWTYVYDNQTDTFLFIEHETRGPDGLNIQNVSSLGIDNGSVTQATTSDVTASFLVTNSGREYTLPDVDYTRFHVYEAVSMETSDYGNGALMKRIAVDSLVGSAD